MGILRMTIHDIKGIENGIVEIPIEMVFTLWWEVMVWGKAQLCPALPSCCHDTT